MRKKSNNIKGQRAARVGIDSEKDIVKLINEDNSFTEQILECVNFLGLPIKGKIIASLNPNRNAKTDVIIMNDEEIGISVKSSTKTSFHQLDRRRLEEWKSLLDMSDEVFNIIKESILRISKNPKEKFILEPDRPIVKKFFTEHLREILNEIFKKDEENLKIFMINDKRRGIRKIYIFSMDDVINFLYNNAKNNICFSDKGIIQLGDFITVQRKGGNGKHIKIPKTDWNHPGNQLQFKFSPIKFAEYIVKNKSIVFCIIDY